MAPIRSAVRNRPVTRSVAANANGEQPRAIRRAFKRIASSSSDDLRTSPVRKLRSMARNSRNGSNARRILLSDEDDDDMFESSRSSDVGGSESTRNTSFEDLFDSVDLGSSHATARVRTISFQSTPESSPERTAMVAAELEDSDSSVQMDVVRAVNSFSSSGRGPVLSNGGPEVVTLSPDSPIPGPSHRSARSSGRPRGPRRLNFTSDSDSSAGEPIVINTIDRRTRERRRQEEEDYRLALLMSVQWTEEEEEAKRRKVRRSPPRQRQKTTCSSAPQRPLAPGQHCIICFEDQPIQPVGCLNCRQLIGCRKCVMKWRRTTNFSELNRRSPLSSGCSSLNHRKCPLCRVEWEDAPEVANWDELRDD